MKISGLTFDCINNLKLGLLVMGFGIDLPKTIILDFNYSPPKTYKKWGIYLTLLFFSFSITNDKEVNY